MPDLSYRSPKTEVKDSPIHGRGLFAKEPIDEGEIVGIKGGYILSTQAWAPIETELGSAEIPIAEGFVIAPTTDDEREGSMLFTNHSCDPNIAIAGQIVFVALRAIAHGEELTHDWATTDDDDYEMACNCGSPNCRRTVTGKDWQRPDLQRRYRGHFAWYLQRKIDDLPHHSGPTGQATT